MLINRCYFTAKLNYKSIGSKPELDRKMTPTPDEDRGYIYLSKSLSLLTIQQIMRFQVRHVEDEDLRVKFNFLEAVGRQRYD